MSQPVDCRGFHMWDSCGVCTACGMKQVPTEQAVTGDSGSDANREAVVSFRARPIETAPDSTIIRLYDPVFGWERGMVKDGKPQFFECRYGAEPTRWAWPGEMHPNPQSGSGTTPSTLSSEPLQVGPNKQEFPSEEESRKAFEEDYLDRAGYLRFHSDPWDSDKGRYKTADLRRRYRDWNACYRWLKGERK